MAHYKTKLKRNGDKAPPRFKPFLEKGIRQTLTYEDFTTVFFKHILISLTNFVGIKYQ